jgi:hypothetical protein
LRIFDMETSCSCTTASVVYNGIEGPYFNMRDHGTNPKDWSVEINPGDSAQLKVLYDPRVHPDARGAVTRIVTLFTNDPRKGVEEVYAQLNQVD